MRPFEDPYFCWKATTRAGTIASVAVVRETIKKGRATVTVALRLTNGDSVTDSKRLVLTARGWLIGEIWRATEGQDAADQVPEGETAWPSSLIRGEGRGTRTRDPVRQCPAMAPDASRAGSLRAPTIRPPDQAGLTPGRQSGEPADGRDGGRTCPDPKLGLGTRVLVLCLQHDVRSAFGSVTDSRRGMQPASRSSCPGCEPGADPLDETLELRWCEVHAPSQAGLDDGRVHFNTQGTSSEEAGGEDNRRWCDLLHRPVR
jgi:hypothetical protein